MPKNEKQKRNLGIKDELQKVRTEKSDVIEARKTLALRMSQFTFLCWKVVQLGEKFAPESNQVASILDFEIIGEIVKRYIPLENTANLDLILTGVLQQSIKKSIQGAVQNLTEIENINIHLLEEMHNAIQLVESIDREVDIENIVVLAWLQIVIETLSKAFQQLVEGRILDKSTLGKINRNVSHLLGPELEEETLTSLEDKKKQYEGEVEDIPIQRDRFNRSITRSDALKRGLITGGITAVSYLLTRELAVSIGVEGILTLYSILLNVLYSDSLNNSAKESRTNLSDISAIIQRINRLRS